MRRQRSWDRSILVIGESDAPAFREPLRSMRQSAAVRCVPDIENARAELEHGATPYLILFAQTRRGQFCDEHVKELSAASPLSQFACLLGPWCEGEPRTGQPLSGVTRVYWHQWKSQFRRELWCSPKSSRWSQPRIMTAADRAMLVEPRPIALPTQVVVASESRAVFESLAVGLRHFQCEPVFRNSRLSDPPQPVDSALIWDSAQWSDSEAARFAAVRKQMLGRAVVLLGWPRLDQVEAAHSLGADEVLSKPLQLEELALCLQTRSKRQAA